MLGLFFKKIIQVFGFLEESPTRRSTDESTEQFSTHESDGWLSLEEELKQIAHDNRHFDLDTITPKLEKESLGGDLVTDELMSGVIAADRPANDRQVGAHSQYKALPKVQTTSITASQEMGYQQLSHMSVSFVSNSSQSHSAPVNSQVSAQTKQAQNSQETVTHRLAEYNQAVSPQRAKAIKTLKVHGLRSLDKKTNRRSSSVPQNHDVILSQSQINEVQTHPQESATHRMEKPSQDQTRLMELEHNLEYATNKAEQTWQAEESNISPKLLKELSQEKQSTNQSSVQSPIPNIEQQAIPEVNEKLQPKVQNIQPSQTKDKKKKKPKKMDSSSETQTAEKDTAEIAILGDPLNHDLAEFARNRYIDYDKIRIKNIKKKS